jgi:hypothetical protein
MVAPGSGNISVAPQFHSISRYAEHYPEGVFNIELERSIKHSPNSPFEILSSFSWDWSVVLSLTITVFTMLTFKLYLHGIFTIGSLPQFSSADSFRESCLSFKPQIESANVELVEFVPKDTGTALPYRDPTCGGPGISPKVNQDVCRITLYIQTSAQSGVHFESWLPREWNGRFLATGNGGIGGCEFLKSFSKTSSKQAQALIITDWHIPRAMVLLQLGQIMATMEPQGNHSIRIQMLSGILQDDRECFGASFRASGSQVFTDCTKPFWPEKKCLNHSMANHMQDRTSSAALKVDVKASGVQRNIPKTLTAL